MKTRYSSDATQSRGRVRRTVTGVIALILIATLDALPASASHSATPTIIHTDGAQSVVAPHSPVGKQLTWLLGVGSLLPLSSKEESAHFDATFIAAEPVTQLNNALASLGSTGSKVALLSISDVTADALKAVLEIGSITFNVQLAVDSTGLIAGRADSYPHRLFVDPT
jgi:hypothetical protein